MPIDRKELAQRLERAVEIRRLIRRATLEWRALGDKILRERALGPRRPDGGRPLRR